MDILVVDAKRKTSRVVTLTAEEEATFEAERAARPVPEPKRDPLTELDDVKTRLAALEAARP